MKYRYCFCTQYMCRFAVKIALFHVISSVYLSIKIVGQQELYDCSLLKSTKPPSCAFQPNMELPTECKDMGNTLVSNVDQGMFLSGKRSAEETLKDYGYHFKQYEGAKRMMSINDDDKGFEFDVNNGNRDLNQQRYEAIGEIITDLVYESLEHDLKLEKVPIPVNAKTKDPKGFFFKSSDALDADKLLILIHGSGVVRAGQWARSLIINESWESGTMEPYIIQAQEEGFGIIITNGNHNFDPEKRQRIKGSENPQDHCVYIWNHFIRGAQAKDIVMVAHSFGGVVVHHLVRNVPESMERIKAVAFTDSVHCLGTNEKKAIKEWFKKKTRNWISSQRPLDEPIMYSHGRDCQLVSAGTPDHVRTSYVSKDSVFKFIHDKLQETDNIQPAHDKSGVTKNMENNEMSEETMNGDATKVTANTDVSGETMNSDVNRETANMNMSGETMSEDVNKETATTDVSGETMNDDVNKETATTDVSGETMNDDVNKETATTNVSGETMNDNVNKETANTDVSGETMNDNVTKETANTNVSGETMNDNVNKETANTDVSGETMNEDVNKETATTNVSVEIMNGDVNKETTGTDERMNNVAKETASTAL